MALIRILLIDDDQTSREGIAGFLRDVSKFEVTEYSRGDEALKHLEIARSQYTVVLLDFVLDHPLSGDEILKELRLKYSQLPVVVFTGRDPAGGIQALSQGAYAFMQRPLDFIEMEKIIRNLAEQDMIFWEMAKDVRQILGSDLCLAWRLDKREHKFRVVAWDGEEELDEVYRQKIRLDPEDPSVLEFLKRGEPVYVSDVTDLQRASKYLHREEAKERGWTSLISIPLFRRQRIIGLIDSYTYEPFKFLNKAHRRSVKSMLRAFANQAAEAVRNAELSEQLQALHGINQSLAGTFEEETIIGQILSKGLELVGADSGWLYLIDIDTGKLVFKDGQGIPAELREPERELGLGITGWVAQMGRALNVPDVSKSVYYKPTPGLEVKSEMAVPLRREEQTIGVLTAKSRHRNTFTDDDVTLLMSLATQAAIVIGRTKLTRHLQEVSRLALTADYTKLKDYVVGAVRDLTGADVNLWMMSDAAEERDQFLRIVASRGNFDPIYLATATTPLAPDQSITALALAQGYPIVRKNILEDVEEPRFYHYAEAESQDWHAYMTVPLIGRENESLGSLSLYSREIAKFGPPEIELMRTFANHAAIVFQQQERLFTLRQLAQVGNTLTWNIASQPKRLLQQVTEAACTLIKADCAVIYPYDPLKGHFYEQEMIIATGLRTPRWRVTDKLRERGLGALVRQTGEIVVHSLEPEEIEINLAKVNEPGVDRQFITKIIRETKFIQREDIKAFVGISLRAGQSEDNDELKSQEVGVLYLNFRRPHRFTEEELQIIQIYAHQVANIIRSARLFSEAQRQTRELEALQQTALKIVAQEDLPTLLNAVVEEAIKLLKAKGGRVYLRLPNQHKLQLVAAKEVDSNILRPSEALDEYLTWEGRSEWLASLLTAVIEAPLLLGGEIIGMIAVFDDPKKRKFTKEDLPILERLAQQAALAIHNARLLEESQNRLKVLDTLQETSLNIIRQLDSKELIRVIVERATDVMAAGRYRGIGVAYWQCDYQNKKAVIVYSSNPDFVGTELKSHIGLVGKVIETGQAQYINDYPNWSGRASVFEEKGWASMIKNLIEVPVKKGDEVIAILAISDASIRFAQHLKNHIIETQLLLAT